jgi:hypothetical protein
LGELVGLGSAVSATWRESVTGTAATRSSQISRQYAKVLLGQNMRHALYRAWHTTESRTMEGFFITSILPVFSSMTFVTRFNT